MTSLVVDLYDQARREFPMPIDIEKRMKRYHALVKERNGDVPADVKWCRECGAQLDDHGVPYGADYPPPADTHSVDPDTARAALNVALHHAVANPVPWRVRSAEERGELEGAYSVLKALGGDDEKWWLDFHKLLSSGSAPSRRDEEQDHRHVWNAQGECVGCDASLSAESLEAARRLSADNPEQDVEKREAP